MFEDEEDSRVGLIWSHNEDLYLLQNIKENKSIEEIAIMHKRKEQGIRIRIKNVAFKLYKQGMNKKEISQKTKLNIDTINEIIDENNCKKSNNFDVKKEILNIKNEIVDIRLDMINIKTLIFEMKNDIFKLNDKFNS